MTNTNFSLFSNDPPWNFFNNRGSNKNLLETPVPQKSSTTSKESSLTVPSTLIKYPKAKQTEEIAILKQSDEEVSSIFQQSSSLSQKKVQILTQTSLQKTPVLSQASLQKTPFLVVYYRPTVRTLEQIENAWKICIFPLFICWNRFVDFNRGINRKCINLATVRPQFHDAYHQHLWKLHELFIAWTHLKRQVTHIPVDLDPILNNYYVSRHSAIIILGFSPKVHYEYKVKTA
ncbi:MAG: hypothetical protein JWO53_1373 [Chlamydiia bacterium]|nr:hypothetical protein [Chlamydiia bacterium]